MLLVYGHYKYFNPFSARSEFRRLIPSSKVDPRAVRVNPLGTHTYGQVDYSLITFTYSPGRKEEPFKI